jgi:hypothetical protein
VIACSIRTQLAQFALDLLERLVAPSGSGDAMATVTAASRALRMTLTRKP